MNNLIKKITPIYTIIVLIIDIILINVGVYIGFLIKFEFNSIPLFNLQPFIEIIPFITISALLYFDLYGLFSVFKKTLYETIYSIFFVLILLTITTTAISYFNQGFSFPRMVLILMPFIQFALLVLWRTCLWLLREHFVPSKDVLVVANSEELDKILEKLRYSADSKLLNIKYICDPRNVTDLYKYIDESATVFIGSDISKESKSNIIGYCMNEKKGVYLIPELFEIVMLNAKIEQFDDIPTFRIESLNLTLEQRFVKRLFDIIVSVIGIIVTAPFMIIIAMWIECSSKGPIIYTQERLTRKNKSFNQYKFRTMVVDAESETGPTLATENDPRLTKIGKILKRFRVDELPQLFNVLMGQMSIVGPRPERQYFADEYIKSIPEFKLRTGVKAGITGLAQILGKYTTSPNDKARYDLVYIKNYSLFYDIKIILQTLKVLVSKEANAGLKKGDKL